MRTRVSKARGKSATGAEPGQLRITAGELRGRLIECPQTGDVRPMLSKTRMALFNVLADDIKGARVWDCFGGSGLLGLEALSRGASHCVFIERNSRHADVIARNIKALGLGRRATLLRGDAFRLVSPGMTRPVHAPASFIFLDPPHAMIADIDSGPFWPWLMTLHHTPLIDGFTVPVIGHHANLRVPDEIGAFMVTDRREYGSVAFSILVNSDHPDDEDG